MIRAEIILPDGQIPLGIALEAMKRFHAAFDDAFVTYLSIDDDQHSECQSIILFAEPHPKTNSIIRNSEKRN